MSDIVVQANPDTLLVSLRLKTAVAAFVQDMLNGNPRPDEEPHFVDAREWTRENWKLHLSAVPVVAWREHDKGGMRPLLGGPMTATLKALFPYSPPETRKGVFTRPFIKLGNAGYWDGGTSLIEEREAVASWARELHRHMMEIYESGKPLTETGKAE